ncbi:flagellar protein FlaG [Bacillus ectoiniformans]|uniref:flagellar protein FlaG n=1 Tax=Bacillus ectoiniformans TaxID=1494429 RepID=UPI00195A1F09|nr:flagellar protein FlaG [Bacillus ectoiniformans]MBM7649380.1 flagellar protein FlaG [Bacillus ectoiniformans]
MIDKVASSSISFTPRVGNEKSTPNLDQVKDIAKEANEQAQLPKKEEMEKVVKGMNDFLKPANTHLKFEFHDELEEYYVAVVDDVTQEIIKEIPSKKLLDIYAAMTDFIGIMVDKKI